MPTLVHAVRRGTLFRRSVAGTATGALLVALAACEGGGDAAAAPEIDVEVEPASVTGTVALMRGPQLRPAGPR